MKADANKITFYFFAAAIGLALLLGLVFALYSAFGN
jgi:hypothetical protein